MFNIREATGLELVNTFEGAANESTTTEGFKGDDNTVARGRENIVLELETYQEDFLDNDIVLDYSAKAVEVMRTLGLQNDCYVSTNGRKADKFIVVRTTLATDLWEAWNSKKQCKPQVITLNTTF